MLKRLLVFIFCVFFPFFCWADVPSELKSDNSMLEKGKSSVVELVIPFDVTVDHIDIPFVDGLNVRFLKKEKIKNKTVFRYRVVPLKEGAFLIGPVVFYEDGKKVVSNSLGLKCVLKDDREVVNKTKEPIDDHIFLEVFTDKKEVYVDQKATLFIVLYSDWIDLENIEVSSLRSKDIIFEDMSEKKIKMKKQGDQNFVTLMYSSSFYAVTTGEYVIDPVVVSFDIAKHRGSAENFDEDMLNDNKAYYDDLIGYADSKHMKLTSEPLHLKVRSFPEDKKDQYFRGNIGKNMELISEHMYDQQKEILTVTAQLKGAEDMGVVKPPRFGSLKGLELSDTKSSYKKGEADFVFELKVVSEEVFKVPDLILTYFDPVIEKYISVTKKGVSFRLQKQSLERVSRVKEEDQRQIMPQKKSVGVVYGISKIRSVVLFVCSMLLFLWLFIVKVYSRHINSMNYDIHYNARFKAFSLYKQKKHTCAEHLASLDQKQFFASVYDMLRSYFGIRLFISKESAIKEEVIQRLSDSISFEEKHAVEKVFSLIYEGLYSTHFFTKEMLLNVFKQVNANIEQMNKKREL